MLAPYNERRGANLDGRRTENPRPFVQFLAALVVFCTFLILLSGCGGGSYVIATCSYLDSSGEIIRSRCRVDTYQGKPPLWSGLPSCVDGYPSGVGACRR